MSDLVQKGYAASRVHYTRTGIKTDAPMDVILDSINVQKNGLADIG
jgi:tRNA G26 N,N-dimethylase Trm1